jgi:hypothetical protein
VVQPGDIGFGGKRAGFYPSAVRLFTKSKWSHCFVITPPVLGEISVIEADLKVQVVPFHKEYILKDADYYEVWRPIRSNESLLYSAVADLYKKDAGEIYGFLQIPWFAIRSLLGKVGIKISKNWFPSGEICSETLWQYMHNLGGEYRKAVELLGENESSPADLYNIVKDRNDLFEFVLRRD